MSAWDTTTQGREMANQRRVQVVHPPTVQELTPWERDCWEVENREQLQAERARGRG